MEGFSREVTDGPVMSSDPGIVKDFMPGGQYLEFDDECLNFLSPTYHLFFVQACITSQRLSITRTWNP